ncbi:MAG TPA: hypothetical protein VF746_26740 [Longimicrobium sp.]|jgi:hypothetical protein
MRTPSVFPVPRRVALLLAALLHLLGVAAGPALHGWTRPDPHLPGWSSDREDAPLAAHDELTCVICQAGSGPALPAPADVPFVREAPHTAPVPASAPLRATPGLARTQARAPPVSLV